MAKKNSGVCVLLFLAFLSAFGEYLPAASRTNARWDLQRVGRRWSTRGAVRTSHFCRSGSSGDERCSHADRAWLESHSQLSFRTLLCWSHSPVAFILYASQRKSGALLSQGYKGSLVHVLPSSLSGRERQWQHKGFVLYSQGWRRGSFLAAMWSLPQSPTSSGNILHLGFEGETVGLWQSLETIVK